MYMDYRTEHDTMGDVQVPADRLWAAQTQRSFMNFKIGEPASMPREVIEAFAYLKKAAAITNCELGVLSEEKRDLISSVCDEIVAGKLWAQFPLVIWQTGSGTQSNMNVNEVIANRAQQLKGYRLGEGKTIIHPNDDVNKSQSSNDTFPTAMHIAAYKKLMEVTLPGLQRLRDSLAARSEEMRNVVKIGRTHMMDATPLTMGQEFSGYVSQIDHGMRALQNALPHLSELALWAPGSTPRRGTRSVLQRLLRSLRVSLLFPRKINLSRWPAMMPLWRRTARLSSWPFR